MLLASGTSEPCKQAHPQTQARQHCCTPQELFQLLMRQLFDPNFGMFVLTEGRVYWFRASSLELAMEFELVGTLLGLAIFNNHILDLAFPTLVYQ